MEVVTGKIGTVAAEINAFLLDTFVDITWFGHIEEGYCTIFITTSNAEGFFIWNTHILGDRRPQLFILICQIHWTVEAIQSTWRCHLLIIHEFPFLCPDTN